MVKSTKKRTRKESSTSSNGLEIGHKIGCIFFGEKLAEWRHLSFASFYEHTDLR